MEITATRGAASVSTGVAESSTDFKIATNTHMFRVLSDGLYSDKITAVLREVGCNAVDAHKAAGKPELPIEVKLPNQLDPSFYIKDFGPGLDELELRELYTTYGWSNKRGDNSQTGGFGLGSKSPFAYVDSFTVESVKNGVKLTMAAFLQGGNPVIAKLGEEPAPDNWPSGVCVRFAVAPRDFLEFQAKAAVVFSWFDTTPNVLGVPPGCVQAFSDETRFSERFSLKTFKPARGCLVVMGGVAYPLKKEALDACKKFSLAQSLLTDGRLIMRLPLGAVLMTPSRESLDYGPKTVQALNGFVEEAADELTTWLSQCLALPTSCARERFASTTALRQNIAGLSVDNALHGRGLRGSSALDSSSVVNLPYYFGLTPGFASNTTIPKAAAADVKGAKLKPKQVSVCLPRWGGRRLGVLKFTEIDSGVSDGGHERATVELNRHTSIVVCAGSAQWTLVRDAFKSKKLHGIVIRTGSQSAAQEAEDYARYLFEAWGAIPPENLVFAKDLFAAELAAKLSQRSSSSRKAGQGRTPVGGATGTVVQEALLEYLPRDDEQLPPAGGLPKVTATQYLDECGTEDCAYLIAHMRAGGLVSMLDGEGLEFACLEDFKAMRILGKLGAWRQVLGLPAGRILVLRSVTDVKRLKLREKNFINLAQGLWEKTRGLKAETEARLRAVMPAVLCAEVRPSNDYIERRDWPKLFHTAVLKGSPERDMLASRYPKSAVLAALKERDGYYVEQKQMNPSLVHGARSLARQCNVHVVDPAVSAAWELAQVLLMLDSSAMCSALNAPLGSEGRAMAASLLDTIFLHEDLKRVQGDRPQGDLFT